MRPTVAATDVETLEAVVIATDNDPENLLFTAVLFDQERDDAMLAEIERLQRVVERMAEQEPTRLRWRLWLHWTKTTKRIAMLTTRTRAVLMLSPHMGHANRSNSNSIIDARFVATQEQCKKRA